MFAGMVPGQGEYPKSRLEKSVAAFLERTMLPGLSLRLHLLQLQQGLSDTR